MSGYGFTVPTSGYDNENRLVSYQRTNNTLNESWNHSLVHWPPDKVTTSNSPAHMAGKLGKKTTGGARTRYGDMTLSSRGTSVGGGPP